LTVRGLTFAAGGRSLIRDISFEASGGTFVAICGPNGAGKSTLLRLISGELRPSAGEVRIGGVPVHALGQRRLASMRALMQQNSGSAVAFMALEIVRLATDGTCAGLSRIERDDICRDVLATTDAAALASQSFQALSVGERQRVSYARALAQLAAGRALEKSQILLLDEPTASLDIRHQLMLLDHARSLAHGKETLVIAVLHDLTLASAFADRILVLRQGRIESEATKGERLSRGVIEQVFNVSMEQEVCPVSPWMPFSP
jgi:iron complex transport system ATP-binding protein